MNQVNHLTKILFFGMLQWAVVGCQSISAPPLPKGANPTEEIDKLRAAEQAAFGEQVDVLSPTHFSEAQKALTDAEKSRDAGDKPETILKLVAEGHAYLKKATDTAAISRSSLGEAVEKRAEALKVDAAKFAKKSFDDLDKELKKATRKIEDNDTSSATKNRDSLVKGYQKVKVEAIKEAELGQAIKDIEKAQKEEAKKYVPHTLTETIVIFKEANAAIDKNPDDPAQWKPKAEGARSASSRLLQFTRDGKAIGGRNPEAVLLQREADQKKIAEKNAALGQMKKEGEEKQSTIAGLEAEKKQLTTKQKFDELFDKAHKAFSAAEADVFRQGDKLILRLKGLEFVKGSGEIESKNYEVLNKVGEVVKSFGKSHVTVEGHTDSMGGATTNQKLSEKRATAVAKYLRVNSGIPEESVKAIGYGYQKPIATNKTAAGRAQNRRVDVVVEPERESEHEKAKVTE